MKTKLISRAVAVIALVGLLGTAAQAGRGSGGGEPLLPMFFECHNVSNAADPNLTVTIPDGTLENPFLGTARHDLRIGPMALACIQVDVLGDLPANFPEISKDVHCYSISILTTPRPQVTPKNWILDDPIGGVQTVRPSAPQYLCAVGVANPAP